MTERLGVNIMGHTTYRNPVHGVEDGVKNEENPSAHLPRIQFMELKVNQV